MHLFILLLLVLSFKSYSQQFPVGMYESAMGNSGVAISDPMAASYYNPSLLKYKTKDSYNLSANSFDSYKAKSDDSQVSSLGLNPGYLSTVLVGDALVHEIFMANLGPSEYFLTTSSDSATLLSETDIDLSAQRFLFGYSMAFRSVPFALSYFGQFNQIRAFSFTESESLNSNERSTTKARSHYTTLGLGVSVSGHFKFDIYTLGMHYRSRRWNIYKKSEGGSTSYIHGGTSATDYSVVTGEASTSVQSTGQSIAIGHGFKMGDVEFITDSILNETEELSYKFNLSQSFGFRVTSENQHQFLCGVQQNLNDLIKKFGDDTYYSVGYSWKTRELRSAVGLYYYHSELDNEISAMGVSFSSEFGY